jgi:hypothetical protein
MQTRPEWPRHFLTVLLTLACLGAGYGFYKMNQDDAINAACFTFGILGILLSYLRNRPRK